MVNIFLVLNHIAKKMHKVELFTKFIRVRFVFGQFTSKRFRPSPRSLDPFYTVSY